MSPSKHSVALQFLQDLQRCNFFVRICAILLGLHDDSSNLGWCPSSPSENKIADETPNSVAEKPDELISKHEAVTKVVEDTASCKKTIKEVSEKPPKRKITHDMVLEEQYKALLLKQSNLKLNKKKLELEIALLEQKCANIKETETCGNLMTTINLSPIVAGRSFLS